MDAVAVMAPGRFRRRLSDDRSDVAEPSSGSTNTDTVSRSWLGGSDGTGSTRGRLPWLSPRERRHPLRDVRLSCFRSYLPGSIGGPPDGDASCSDSSPRSPMTPRTPRLPGSPQVTKDKEEKTRGLSLSVRRSPGRSRGTKSSDNVYFVSPPRVSPEQDNKQQEQQQQEQQTAQPASRLSSSNAQGHGSNLSARLRALSARCMALVHSNKATITQGKRSARPCKQRSFSSGALPGLHDFQRRQLNPIYRDDCDDQPEDEETPLSPSPSSGFLGGDEDGDSGILVSEAASTAFSTPLSSLPGCGGREALAVASFSAASASGRGVRGCRGSLPWGGGAGGVGALGVALGASAASRALRSASLDRELLGGSPLLDQEDDPDEHDIGAPSQARQSRSSTKSSSSEISEIFSRFQRRRVAGTSATSGTTNIATSTSSSSSSSPPLLPPQRTGAGPGGGAGGSGGAGGGRVGVRREFHLVRLTRTTPSEELGIFIAKSDAPDRGAQGYVVAHVVPGGLAHRDGQLRLGDELVVVNGRQLRGLSMAAARHRLRAGPNQVDIVIARPASNQCQCQSSEGRDSGLDTSGSGDSMTDSRDSSCSCKAADQTPSPARRVLPESSVDYENVILRPRDRVPVLSDGYSSSKASSSTTEPRTSLPTASSGADAAAAAATAPRAPSPSACGPSPVPTRQQLFQKHIVPASTKASRRSLALVSRSSSPPLEPLEALEISDPPAETQHHSLKRRARRHGGGRHGLQHGLQHGHAGDGLGHGATHPTEYRVELRKGPGCGALGFTVVGGADSPRGPLPIFVRSVLQGGQAARDGRLQPGDELLTLNGQPLRGATHSEAVAMFRAVRAGPVVLTLCRRTTKKAQSCSDLVVGQSAAHQDDS